MNPQITKLIETIKNSLRVEVFVSNYKDGRKSEMTFASSLTSAMRQIEIAKQYPCFVYGRVYQDGVSIFETEAEDFMRY